MRSPVFVFALAACVVSACGAAPTRPNLPPPEYEEPGGAVVGAASIQAGPDAGQPPMPPSATPAPR
jgi:hypothetical protein